MLRRLLRPAVHKWRRLLVQERGRLFARQPVTIQGSGAQVRPNHLREFFDGHRTGPGIWKWRHYFEIYDRHFAKFRGRELNLLEIGIYSGGSLMMWRDYFGNRCTIHGVDNQAECLAYESSSVRVYIGDQGDPAFWSNTRKSLPRLDIVVDDGGHTYDQQRTTLEWLLPHMRPGGVYLCEDIHNTGNEFAAFVYGMADELNSVTDVKSDPSTPDQRLTSRATGIQTGIKSICLYPFVAVIELSDEPVDGFVAPKHGTEWQPFLS